MNDNEINEFLDKHKELFENLKILEDLEKEGLASSKEIEIARWLQNHKEGLQNTLSVLNNPAHDLLPDSLYFIYLENYENEVIKVLRKEAASSLQLNPEECLLINKNFVIIVLGKQILIPPK